MKTIFKLLLILFLGVAIQSCKAKKSSSNSASAVTSDSAGIKSITYGKIRYSGGDGSTKEKAIKIMNAKGSSDGVSAEYYYIGKVEGERGKDWSMKKQALIMDSLIYDKLIINAKGKEKEYWFDISDFFGKF